MPPRLPQGRGRRRAGLRKPHRQARRNRRRPGEFANIRQFMRVGDAGHVEDFGPPGGAFDDVLVGFRLIRAARTSHNRRHIRPPPSPRRGWRGSPRRRCAPAAGRPPRPRALRLRTRYDSRRRARMASCVSPSTSTATPRACAKGASAATIFLFSPGSRPAARKSRQAMSPAPSAASSAGAKAAASEIGGVMR